MCDISACYADVSPLVAGIGQNQQAYLGNLVCLIAFAMGFLPKSPRAIHLY